MDAAVDLFWFFRSPYSYFAVRDPSFFSPDNLNSMDAALSDPASHRAAVEENLEALAKSGHWGVPTFVFEGEPFFGEDRIDTLRWRLGGKALRRA